ncbi:MAG TPA: DUF1345 domain-containing protein [Rhizomicrobium sp.]|nr:DUF1345 domain-containing protein [Rhizomicrobium sp.]
MLFARSHLTHHWRFYACFLLGAVVYLLLGALPPPVRLLAGGDVFFLSYIAMLSFIALNITPGQLDKRADVEDEGIALVILFALVMIGFCMFAIVTLLHQKQAVDPYAIVLAVLGAPLGWAMLHMMMAFHYAYLFYSEPGKKKGSGLAFPGTEEPGAADFLYYAFVVGMTFQVSDVQVTSTRLRRTTLAHSIVSFFFNTCLIAMAVNAVVAIAA